jgi:hypothetical protein
VQPRFNLTTNLVFFIICDTFLFAARNGLCQSAVYFSRIGVTLTRLRDSPHSKQFGFNRDVINPQELHIVCDPYPAIRGFSLRILRSSRSVSSTISRPKKG